LVIPSLRLGGLRLVHVLFFFLGLTLCFASTTRLHAQTPKVILASVFDDSMVLQRESPVPIWGWAVPGETVTVTFKGQTKTAVAATGSAWRVLLDPMPADAVPASLAVACAGQVITKTDILVGDVWLGIGQSNMTMILTQGDQQGPYVTPSVQDEIRAAAPYATLRLKRSDAGTFFFNADAKWRTATAAALNNFPSILSMFGINLQKEIDVPLGLIVSAEGSTSTGYYSDARSAIATENYALMTAAAKTRLATAAAFDQTHDDWLDSANLARINGTAIPAAPVRPSDYAGVGYLNYIKPYAGIAVKGILWDQGESGGGFGLNTPKAIETIAQAYRNKFIYNTELPFIYMQKRSGSGSAYDDPLDFENEFQPQPADVVGSLFSWIADEIEFVRLHQPAKRIFMSTAMDLNKNIHPTQKEQYSRRAADVALKEVYGHHRLRTIGPVYRGYQIQDNKIIIHFHYADAGLVARHAAGDALQGFGISGNSLTRWANAAIQGNKIVVSHPDIANPTAAWYALTVGEKQWANVFNRDKFPMYPWKTSPSSTLIPAGTPVPVATASVLTGESPLPVAFDATQSWDPDGGAITTYLWDFGDGTTATGATASHTFAARGRFPVTLTVTDNTGKSQTDTLHIGVGLGLDPTTATTPVSTVTVSPATLALTTDATGQLTAAVLPLDASNPAVTWSSSAPAIASIEAATGLVTALAPGVVTLTATSADGPSGSATLTVTAPAPPPPPPVNTGGLVENSSFENGLANWSVWSAGHTVVADAHTGAAALSVPANTGFQYATTFPVSAGQTLTASAWAKVTGGQYAALQLQFRTTSGANVGSATAIGFTSATYAQKSATLTVPATATRLFLSFWNGGNTSFIVDDVSVTATTPAPPPATYQTWRVEHLGPFSGTVTLEEDALADPDADGLPNLLEYSLDHDPLAPSSAPPLSTSLTPSLPHSLSLSFLRARADLIYEVEASSDLLTWTVIATDPGTISATDPVVVPDPTPGPRRFLRLRVTLR
jgi:sialate O-acetylesterase